MRNPLAKTYYLIIILFFSLIPAMVIGAGISWFSEPAGNALAIAIFGYLFMNLFARRPK